MDHFQTTFAENPVFPVFWPIGPLLALFCAHSKLHGFCMVFHGFAQFFNGFFKELDFKELGVLGYSDLLGVGVLGYSDLLGVGVPMIEKVGAMCRPAAAHCTSIFFPNGLGIDDRASMIGHR